MNIEKLLSDFSERFDPALKKYTEENHPIPNLTDAVGYCINTKGKRLRPFLCVEVCSRLGGDPEKAIPLAAAIELMHSWILIHDDIEDGDTTRRNQPAVWVKYGLAHGINIGDYLQAKVYQLILSYKDMGVSPQIVLKLVDLITRVLIHTTQGQAMDINLRADNNPTEDKYMLTVMNKSGYYLACPILGGAELAGAREDYIQALTDYSKYVGPAFQIQDDLIDLTVGKGRNNVIGNDIREGKKTLLIIHCLANCSSRERNDMLSALTKDKTQKSEDDVSFVMKLLDKYGSKQYALQVSRDLIEKSKAAIKNLPPDLRRFLECLADYMIARST